MRRWAPGLILLAPSLIVLGVFVYGLIGWTTKLSLTDEHDALGSKGFVGLQNFIDLFTEDINGRFVHSLKNLLVFTVVFMLGALLLGLPICTLIFRNYYATTVPVELIEASRVDGAGMLRTFGSVILPLSAPGFVVTVIWQFTSSWNDYLFAIFMSNTRNGPITIALNALAGAQSPDYAASMAGALIASLPTLLVYIVLGRWFIGGLMAGSVKS
ncbi:carbohydrate ABC transporter permease [Dactylosporangium cerinum]|uniref:Carbohydrate ABC transporter permease n=1 Tax=Dactylosporangium cerinum TaxID=1434730 RepID=A0ABV9W687_9ACTN